MQDKITITKVIGCLLHKPDIILDDNYPLDVDDFRDRFHRIVFSAIRNLVMTGNVQSLDITDIDSYLANYDKQYKIFNDNNGFEYLQEAYTIAVIANFDYYYKRLRKFSLLSRLESTGISVKEILDDDILDVTVREQMQAEFDNMTSDDILDIFEKKVLDVKKDFSQEETFQKQAGKDLRTLKEDLKKVPDMGLPCQSKILNTITRGMRKKKLYMRSCPSGGGKTRMAVGDACGISVPYFYDTSEKGWTYTGFAEPTLFVSTELELDEIQSMMIAFVSGVPEYRILDGKYTEDEEERVDQAIKYIEEAPLWLVQLPNFDIDEIQMTIKEHKIDHKIGYVFFDYIFVSLKMLMEVTQKTKGMKLREDNVLYMFVERLKTLCNKIDVHLNTSSQLTGEWKDIKDADQNLLRGCKAMADKLDVGEIVLPVTKKDLEALAPILQNGFFLIPNYVYHIYKVRKGKLSRVKLWVYLDLGTCRTTDCFLTTNDYEIIDIELTDIEKVLESNEEDLANIQAEVGEIEGGFSF